MEAKHYATKQPMGHWRNRRGNQQILGVKWKWKHSNPKSMRPSKSSSKREVYSNTSLTQETRKKNSKSNLEELEIEEQTEAKVSRRK